MFRCFRIIQKLLRGSSSPHPNLSGLLSCFPLRFLARHVSSLRPNLCLCRVIGGRWVLCIISAQHLTVLSRPLYLELENSRQLKHSSLGPKDKLHSLFTCRRFVAGIKAPNRSSYGFKQRGWESSFFPEDSLSNCLSICRTQIRLLLLPVFIIWVTKVWLARYHLDRLCTLLSAVLASFVLLFQFQKCLCMSKSSWPSPVPAT